MLENTTAKIYSDNLTMEAKHVYIISFLTSRYRHNLITIYLKYSLLNALFHFPNFSTAFHKLVIFLMKTNCISLLMHAFVK